MGSCLTPTDQLVDHDTAGPIWGKTGNVVRRGVENGRFESRNTM